MSDAATKAAVLRDGAGRAFNTGNDELGSAALDGAKVLEALAVPGVAELIYGLSGDRGYHATDDQRAALRTLADAAKSQDDAARRGQR